MGLGSGWGEGGEGVQDVHSDCPGPGATGLWGRGAFAPPVGTAKAPQPLVWGSSVGVSPVSTLMQQPSGGTELV